MFYVYRKENEERLSTFSKGSAILRDWITQSKEILSQNEKQKLSIGDEIAALEKQIEAEEAILEEMKSKDDTSSEAEVCVSIIY